MSLLLSELFYELGYSPDLPAYLIVGIELFIWENYILHLFLYCAGTSLYALPVYLIIFQYYQIDWITQKQKLSTVYRYVAIINQHQYQYQ